MLVERRVTGLSRIPQGNTLCRSAGGESRRNRGPGSRHAVGGSASERAWRWPGISHTSVGVGRFGRAGVEGCNTYSPQWLPPAKATPGVKSEKDLASGDQGGRRGRSSAVAMRSTAGKLEED